ncbi:MAG TPA: hypothetical protein VK616_06795 [Flavitalea sp.]|nr:hypothetical protein [Flavitalea sp.]
MVTKHSYMDEAEQNADPKPKESGVNSKDQKNIPRTDPGLKKGYNEKNPSQPQGGFTSESQADEPAEKDQGDESKGQASKKNRVKRPR